MAEEYQGRDIIEEEEEEDEENRSDLSEDQESEEINKDKKSAINLESSFKDTGVYKDIAQKRNDQGF